MRTENDGRARREFNSFMIASGYTRLPADEQKRLWRAYSAAWVPEQPNFRIVLDGPPAVPGERAGRFVEAEDLSGCSQRAGHWHKLDNGYWALEVAASRGRSESGADHPDR